MFYCRCFLLKMRRQHEGGHLFKNTVVFRKLPPRRLLVVRTPALSPSPRGGVWQMQSSLLQSSWQVSLDSHRWGHQIESLEVLTPGGLCVCAGDQGGPRGLRERPSSPPAAARVEAGPWLPCSRLLGWGDLCSRGC